MVMHAYVCDAAASQQACGSFVCRPWGPSSNAAARLPVTAAFCLPARPPVCLPAFSPHHLFLLRYIVKQLSRSERQSFLEFAPDYFRYVATMLHRGQETCLAKVLGVYQVGRLTPAGAVKWVDTSST